MSYNINFELCTLLYLFIFIVSFSTKKQLKNKQSTMFKIFLYLVFVDICLDCISCVTIAYFQQMPLWINIVINSAFLMLQGVAPMVFLMYILVLAKQPLIDNALRNILVYGPATITVIAMISNPFTKVIFYFDDTGYHHGPFHEGLYISMAFYILEILVYLIYVRRALTAKQIALVFFMVVAACAMTAIQFVFPNYLLSGVGLGMAVVIMYLTIENPIVYADTLTTALNREAFVYQTGRMRDEHRPFQIIAIALDNFKIVNEVFGMEGGDQLMRMMVKQLHKLYSRNQVYRYNGDIFAVVLDETAESSKEIDRIQKLLRRQWQINGVEVELSACICRIPKELYNQSNSELIKAIDYGVNVAKQRGKGQYFVMDDSAAKDMERRAAIEHAMMDAIEAGKFEVHYQPIYDTKQGCFHSLEALARLQVDGYGYVSPEEFIRIAEQNGMIMDIGMLVLREVCRLIRDERIDELGISFVEVNLSVVQCMQENYHEDIMELLEHYNVPPTMINLEITETAAAYSEDKLIRNMARMSLMDITFSMDDYGSGYSNVNYLVDMPFSIIKLDKYFVWSAFKKVKMRKILENTISMFHDINLKVVAEGVEDEEMVNALTQLEVEYLQGYYYSKPLPRAALMDLLQGVKA